MKRELNPELNVGDRIVCYYMDGETSVTPGTKGVVTRIGRDPFEPGDDHKIIEVDWDNGSRLALISSTDFWKLDTKEIQEQTGSPEYDFFGKNQEVFQFFDWRFIRDFLNKLRKTGVINMFQAGAFLYSGKDWIDRYYGEKMEYDDDFQDVLDEADEVKDKMIQGTIKYLESQNKEIELESVNRVIRKIAPKMVHMYMLFNK